MLCDYGTRYQSKLFDPAFLRSKGLPVPPWLAKEPPPVPTVFADAKKP
jgi:cysteine synthase A